MRDLLGKLMQQTSPGAAARKLAERGQFREAVRAAEKAGGADPKLEEAAVIWRNRAVAEADGVSGRKNWPPAVADPFPKSVNQIPEIAASALTLEIMEGAILHHGSLIVRGLFDRPAVETMIAGIDQAWAARIEMKEHGGAPGGWYAEAPIDDPKMGVTREFLGQSSLLMADSPHFLAMWPGFLRSSGVFDLMTRHFGEEPILSARKTTLYRVPPTAGALWHQDGAFLGPGIRTINLWTTLSDCGVDAAGLDIVPWRLNEIAPTHTHGAFWDWAVGDGLVEEIAAGRKISRPAFRPGDAVLFDQMCLHRTGMSPDMTKTRYAIESWMFSPSHYHDKSQLLI